MTRLLARPSEQRPELAKTFSSLHAQFASSVGQLPKGLSGGPPHSKSPSSSSSSMTDASSDDSGSKMNSTTATGPVLNCQHCLTGYTAVLS